MNIHAHFNSISPYPGGFYVCHHNRGKSEVVRLNDKMERLDIFKFGKHIHNVYFENDKQYVCNSANAEFVELDAIKKTQIRKLAIPGGFEGATKWFTRGICRGDGFFLVGLSIGVRRAKRRDKNDCFVVKVSDKDFSIMESYKIPKAGGITEVRMISELDKAHNGVPF